MKNDTSVGEHYYSFYPTCGCEMDGDRLCLVLTPKASDVKFGLA